MNTLSRDVLHASCIGFVLAVSATSASAARPAHSLHVANNGIDSVTCGDAGAPCRSISQAIENAAPGDTVLVSPGQYGDLDGDGALGSVGEEHGQIGFGCFCVISVDKPITLLSTHGAAVTRVDASAFAVGTRPFVITASDVELGRPGQGFLATGTPIYDGITILGDTPTRVHVAGNIAKGNATGFKIGGSHNTVDHNLVISSNGFGFDVNGTGNIVRNNVSEESAGFTVTGAGHQLIENISTGPGWGFSIVSGNAYLLRNSVIGNLTGGILIYAGATPVIRDSNIFGNGSPMHPNCGVINQSGLTINATKNFWGAPSGPGSDPADAVCNVGPSRTVTVPARGFPVPVPDSSGNLF